MYQNLGKFITGWILLSGAVATAQDQPPAATSQPLQVQQSIVLDPRDPLAGMGINIHFNQPPDGELDMISKAGFSWLRHACYWKAIEKSKGVYSFAWLEPYFKALEPYHLHAIIMLDCNGNPLYDGGFAPYSDEAISAYGQYAGAMAKHFKGKGVIWEVWNEPNWAMFWKSPGRKLKPGTNIPDFAGRSDAKDHENYAKLALAATKAIREADPDAIVLGPAYGGAPQADFVDIMGKIGVISLWSGFSIHPYPHGNPEDSLSRDFYDPTQKMINPYLTAGQYVPIVVTEAGYSNAWEGIDEKTQGQYLARTYFYNLLCGIPLTVWYDFHDDGNNVKDQEQSFGMTHHDYHPGAANVYDPKPAYFAAVTYANQLKGTQFKQRVKTDQASDYLLEFTTQKDPSSWGKSSFVAWTTAKGTHDLQIHAPKGTYQLTSFDGTMTSTVNCTDGIIPLTLDGGPQYLKPQ